VTDRTREVWATQDQRQGDRRALFEAVRAELGGAYVLYPGAYVDLSPAFVFDDVTFVDVDRRAARFFGDRAGVDQLIAEKRGDGVAPRWRFLHADYTGELPLDDQQFDLLVSLYGGVISDTCTRYLRTGGFLLANPSHGDVAMAALNPGYRLVAAITARQGRYAVRREDLDTYLRPKKPQHVDADTVRAQQRGIAYTRTAFAYLFARDAPHDWNATAR
jgi:hypothetical protein